MVSHVSGLSRIYHRDAWSCSRFQTYVCNFLFGLPQFWEMLHFLICLLKGFHTFGSRRLISFDDNHSSTILTSRLLSSVTLSSHPSPRLQKFTRAFDLFFIKMQESVKYLSLEVKKISHFSSLHLGHRLLKHILINGMRPIKSQVAPVPSFITYRHQLSAWAILINFVQWKALFAKHVRFKGELLDFRRKITGNSRQR